MCVCVWAPFNLVSKVLKTFSPSLFDMNVLAINIKQTNIEAVDTKWFWIILCVQNVIFKQKLYLFIFFVVKIGRGGGRDKVSSSMNNITRQFFNCISSLSWSPCKVSLKSNFFSNTNTGTGVMKIFVWLTHIPLKEDHSKI